MGGGRGTYGLCVEEEDLDTRRVGNDLVDVGRRGLHAVHGGGYRGDVRVVEVTWRVLVRW